MQNSFETFVKAHRAEFDMFEPSAAIWSTIDAGIKVPSSVAASKITWLKYFTFGASIITGVTYFAINSSSESIDHNDNNPKKDLTITSVIDSSKEENIHEVKSVEEEKSLPKSEISLKDSSIILPKTQPLIATAKSNEKGETIITIASTIKADKNIESEKKGKIDPPLPPTPPVPPLPPLPPLPPKKPIDPLKNGLTMHAGEKDTLLNNDTIFSGVKIIEINSSLANIHIGSNDQDLTYVNYAMDENEPRKQKNRRKQKDETKENCSPVSYTLKDSTLVINIDINPKSKKSMDLNQQIDLNLMLPKATIVRINNSIGDIFIDGLTGNDCIIQNSLGTVQINNTTSEFQVSIDSGDLNISECKGNLSVELSLGNFDIHHFIGAINTTISAGDIHISDVDGNLNTNNSLGDQTFNHITGNIKANCSAGDVKFSNVKGNIDLESSLGDIAFENYIGDPTIRSNSGDISGKNIELINNLTITSSLGDVDFDFVNKMDDLSFDLTTDMGTININKDGQKFEETEKLQINKGKIMVKGYTNSGNQQFK